MGGVAVGAGTIVVVVTFWDVTIGGVAIGGMTGWGEGTGDIGGVCEGGRSLDGAGVGVVVMEGRYAGDLEGGKLTCQERRGEEGRLGLLWHAHYFSHCAHMAASQTRNPI